MIKENKRILMITSLIILLPVLVGLLLWNQLPEQVPVHFNSEGIADSYQSKLWGVVFVYLLVFACHWFAAIVTSVDPRRRNISSKIYRLVLWICPVISIFMGIVIYGTALKWPWVNVNVMANLVVGVIFVFTGNYLPKCRQNYTIGIKLPWTLSDTENWDRTHRFAGKIWMLCGVLEIIVGFLPIARFEIVMIALILLATVPVALYSYLLYRKKMG